MRIRLVILLFILLPSITLMAHQRHALLVGISDYPEGSGWNKLHAYNDIRLTKETLKSIDKNWQITSLEDSKATYKGILQTFHDFSLCVGKGDQCLIVFSCHGQQITDLDGDEKEMKGNEFYDESIVPYDALIAFDWHGSGYKGEKHLRDDEINRLLSEIKSRIGPKGQLVVLYDACHSGDLSRAKQEQLESSEFPIRSSLDAFKIPINQVMKVKKPELHSIDWVSISACDSNCNNYEVKIDGNLYGRLVYSFCKVVRKGVSLSELVSGMESLYKVFPTDADRPRQILKNDTPNELSNILLFYD